MGELNDAVILALTKRQLDEKCKAFIDKYNCLPAFAVVPKGFEGPIQQYVNQKYKAKTSSGNPILIVGCNYINSVYFDVEVFGM